MLREAFVALFLSTSISLGMFWLLPSAGWAEESDPTPNEENETMVEAGSKVGIEYTLTLTDGTKVDGNVGEDALRFQQGAGQLIPGLEKALAGMQVGESKQVTLAPEEGYGPVNPAAFTEVDVAELPDDAREVGVTLVARDDEGRTQRLRVHKIEGDKATLDFNHPLAGQTLIFDVKILEVE
jgi:FKBP-type peptidyl-prolyl cis-trans isomerase 2